MSDPEEKVSQEIKAPVTEKSSVTDEALTNALTETETGKEVAEEKQKPKKEMTPEELEEHKERSNLGRKVKSLEETLAKQTELLQNLTSALGTQNRGTTTDEEVPQYIQTPEDLEKYNAHKQKKEREAKVKYENDYVKSLKGISGQDGEEGEEIMREVLKYDSPFNRMIFGHPIADARTNYAEAKAAFISTKKASEKPQANVKGQKPTVSSQLNVTTREESSRSMEPELDDLTKDFISKTKMKDDSVKAALGIK